jgi:ribonuclease H / adenosylcobalamin/alpha-ribazole phosphatase
VSRRLTVEADGGSRGNPGVAGYGALVRDAETGALLAERAEPLGTASNNVAEYRGLIAGLHAAARIDPGAQVEVRLDSKLAVEQMSGRWKIKHADMRRLALEARDVAAEIVAAGGSVRYTWIPRAENSAADALSNEAMDGHTIDRTWTGGPPVGQAPAAPASGTVGPPPGAAGPGARVILVRHGATDFTAQGRLDGRGGADPSLNDEGRAQAAAAAAAVLDLVRDRPVRVVTSALARAIETGDVLARAVGIDRVVDPGWDEQSLGDWDGRTLRELVEDEAGALRALRDDPAHRPPGGESRADLADRVLAAWQRAVGAGGTSVVVCHRTPIMVVLGHLLEIPQARAWRLALAPGSLTAVDVWGDGEASIAFTNRT